MNSADPFGSRRHQEVAAILLAVLASGCGARFAQMEAVAKPFAPEVLTCWKRQEDVTEGWLVRRRRITRIAVCVPTSVLVELMTARAPRRTPAEIDFFEDHPSVVGFNRTTSVCGAEPANEATVEVDGDRVIVVVDQDVHVVKDVGGPSAESRMTVPSIVRVKLGFEAAFVPLPTRRECGVAPARLMGGAIPRLLGP